MFQGPFEHVLLATDAELAAPGASVALLFVIVPDILKLQARMGIAASATMLRDLDKALSQALGTRGQVMRVGDGRFCALVRGIRNRGHSVLAGEKLARTAEDFFTNAATAIKPRLHIGISLAPGDSADAHELLQLAQIAAETARARAARVVVFDAECRAQVLAPWELGNEFALALDRGELSVFYQPKVAIVGGRTVGVESLMRWLRNDEPVASPDVFIRLAAEAGLMHNATWYSLSNALRTSAAFAGLPVAVNITPEMLHHREFLDMIRTAVATWSVPERKLTLEITEGALIVDFEEATVRLKALRDLGVRVSIDDFGTGYSSLSYFKKVPADELKIDKSFVQGITCNAGDQRLVKTIVDLARHFHLEVVAEGVEDQATLEALAHIGCDVAQGYLFSPALAANRLREWLARRERVSEYPETEAGGERRAELLAAGQIVC